MSGSDSGILRKAMGTYSPWYCVVVAGVSGSGKSTIGKWLAGLLGIVFLDADELHSREAVEKMSKGIALTDEERDSWVERVIGAIVAYRKNGRSVIVACSCLKEWIRRRLVKYGEEEYPDLGGRVVIAWLDIPEEVLLERLSSRSGHFFSSSMLPSQLAAVHESPLDPVNEPYLRILDGSRGEPWEVAERVYDAVRDVIPLARLDRRVSGIASPLSKMDPKPKLRTASAFSVKEHNWRLWIVAGMGDIFERPARLLADRLGVPFASADDLHSRRAIKKMASGSSIDKRYRRAWIERVIGYTVAFRRMRRNTVLACSSVSPWIRERLVSYAEHEDQESGGRACVAWLDAPMELIEQSLQRRIAEEGHFFGPELLPSQQTLVDRSPPDENKESYLRKISVTADSAIESVAREIYAQATFMHPFSP